MQNTSDTSNLFKYLNRNKKLSHDDQVFSKNLLNQLSTNVTPKIFQQLPQTEQFNDRSYSEVLNSYRSTNKKFILEKAQSQDQFTVFQQANEKSMQRLQDFEVMINDLMGKQLKEQIKGLNKENNFSARYLKQIQPLKQTLQNYLNDEEIKVPKAFLIKNNFQNRDNDLNLKIKKAQREAVLFNGKFQKIFDKENKKIKKQKIVRNNQYADYIFEPEDKFNNRKQLQIHEKNFEKRESLNEVSQNDQMAEILKDVNNKHIKRTFKITNICVQPIQIDDINCDYRENAQKIISTNDEFLADFNEKFPQENMELKQKLFLFYVKQGKSNKIEKILKIAKFEDNLSYYWAIRDSGNHTPLHWACRRGDQSIIEILLNYDFYNEIYSLQGQTPFNVVLNLKKPLVEQVNFQLKDKIII